MVDSRADSEPSATSKMLLEVKRCCGELVTEWLPTTPPATEGGAQNDAVEIACFITSLRQWYEAAGGNINDLCDLFDLTPRFELGDATNDVLLYFFEIGKTVKKDLWKSAPSPSKGLFLPLVFRFFGFYNRASTMTSARQLYLRGTNLVKELAPLDVAEARLALLHGMVMRKQGDDDDDEVG
jgi:hypothetical protein